MLDSDMEKKVAKFRSFEEAEKADRDFYDKLTPQARLEILLELLNHGPEQRLERTYRVTKFARRWYLIVDAHSLAFHARPRFTGDLDILVRPTAENAAKILAVLNKFGFADPGMKASRLHHAPNRSFSLVALPTGLIFLRASPGSASGGFRDQNLGGIG